MFPESPVVLPCYSLKMEKKWKIIFWKKYSATQIYVYNAILYYVVIFIRRNWSQILIDLAHNNDDWLIEYSSYMN